MQVDPIKSQTDPNITTTTSTTAEKKTVTGKIKKMFKFFSSKKADIQNKKVSTFPVLVEDTLSIIRLSKGEVQEKLREFGITSFSQLQAFVLNPSNEPLASEIKAWGELRPEAFQPFYDEITKELEKEIQDYVTNCVDEKDGSLAASHYLKQIHSKALWIPSELLERLIAPVLEKQLQYVRSPIKAFRILKTIAELCPGAALQNCRINQFPKSQQIELLTICSKSGISSVCYIAKCLYQIRYDAFKKLLDICLKHTTPDQYLLFDIRYIESYLSENHIRLDQAERTKITNALEQVDRQLSTTSKTNKVSGQIINTVSQIDRLINRYLLYFHFESKGVNYNLRANAKILLDYEQEIEILIKKMNSHDYPVAIRLDNIPHSAIYSVISANSLVGNRINFSNYAHALIYNREFPLSSFINVTFSNREELLELATQDHNFGLYVHHNFSSISDDAKKIILIGIVKNNPNLLSEDMIHYIQKNDEVKHLIQQELQKDPFTQFRLLSTLEPKLNSIAPYITFVMNKGNNMSKLTAFDVSLIHDSVKKASMSNPKLAQILSSWNSQCDFTVCTSCAQLTDYVVEEYQRVQNELQGKELENKTKELELLLEEKNNFYGYKFDEAVSFLQPRLLCLIYALTSPQEERILQLLHLQSKEKNTALANLELAILQFALSHIKEPLDNPNPTAPQTPQQFLFEILNLMGIDTSKYSIDLNSLQIDRTIELLKIIELFSKYPQYSIDQLKTLISKLLQNPESLSSTYKKLHAALPICNYQDFEQILHASDLSKELDTYLEYSIKNLFNVKNEDALKALLRSDILPYFTHFYSQLRIDNSLDTFIQYFNAYLEGKESLQSYRFEHGKNANQFSSISEIVVDFYKAEHEFNVSDYYPAIQKINKDSFLNEILQISNLLFELTSEYINLPILEKILNRPIDSSQIYEAIKSMDKQQIISYFKEIKKDKTLNKYQNEHIALFKFIKYLIDFPNDPYLQDAIKLCNEVELFVGNHGSYFDRPPFALSKMAHLLGVAKQILQKSDKQFPNLKCTWTHDPDTLLTISDKVIGSCQGIMRYRDQNETLIGRVSHGKQKMLILFDNNTKQELGALTTKLLSDGKGNPYILVEPAYIAPGSPLPVNELFKLGLSMIVDNASHHNIPVVVDSANPAISEVFFNITFLPQPLLSKVGEAQAEYEDFGRMREQYSDYMLSNAIIVSRK